MGNQSSFLADMVYRVFPNLEPTQHQLDSGFGVNGLQSLFSPRSTPTPKSPYGRNGSFSSSVYLPSPSLPRDAASALNGPSDLYGRSVSAGANGPSGAMVRLSAEKAATAAYRAHTEPKPMGMNAFEVSSLSLRVLDLWERLGKDSIRMLKRSFKEVSGPESFLFGSPDLRWRIVGVEVRKELGLLTASIASIAERCDPSLVDEVQMHCWNVSRKRRRSSLFEEDEQTMLISTLDAMAAATGTLRDEMEVLDSLMPSSHPLRIPAEANDLDPFAGHKSGAPSPKPSPAANQAKRQQMVRVQLAKLQQLQRDSLWSQDFDWTVLLLSVALSVLWHKFREVFGRPRVEDEEVDKTLGAAGLSLHYANLVLMLDNLVQRPNVINTTGARNEVYDKLPANVKAGVRARLRQSPLQLDPDLVLELRRTVTHILSWMVPLAEATVAWESERSFSSNVPRRRRHHLGETLYYADQDQFELLLIELLVTLTHTLGPKNKHNRAAALAQVELLGKTGEDDVPLPPVPHATLPKLEPKNGKTVHASPRASKPRSTTPRPGYAAKTIHDIEPKLESGVPSGDLYEEPPSQELDYPEEKSVDASDGDMGEDGDSNPASPASTSQRVRRPAPRPPPGFGKAVNHRAVNDFRPQLMG